MGDILLLPLKLSYILKLKQPFKVALIMLILFIFADTTLH